MRAIVQRAHAARVEVDGEVVGQVGRGLCAFVGAEAGDTEADRRYIADKIAHLRIFPDEQDRMNRSLLDIGGEALLVSQFTLFGDVRRGRRPSFTGAMAPEEAREAFAKFVEAMKARGVPVATGRFQATMRVVVDGDGPVTIMLDSRKLF